MLSRALLVQILDNDLIARGLGDPEASMLIEWLVEMAEEIAVHQKSEQVQARIGSLTARGRAIGRFIHLWCHQKDQGAAAQLAAVERFGWPLPSYGIDPCELLSRILGWEKKAIQAQEQTGTEPRRSVA